MILDFFFFLTIAGGDLGQKYNCWVLSAICLGASPGIAKPSGYSFDCSCLGVVNGPLHTHSCVHHTLS